MATKNARPRFTEEGYPAAYWVALSVLSYIFGGIMSTIPRGYKAVEVKVGDVPVSFLMCRSCGALVALTETHRNWHKRYGG